MLPFISAKNLGREWLVHMVGVCLTLKETVAMFSKEIAQFYIPPAVRESSCPSMFLLKRGIVRLFGFSYSRGLVALIHWMKSNTEFFLL